MVLVFKDYTRAPTRISSVPIESLDAIKDWLTNVEIVYSEGPNPLNWPNVMKEITDDLPGFVEQGGWAFLQEDSEEEQEQEPSDQEDSDFDEQEFSDESSDSGSEDASDEEGEEEEDEEEEDSSASEAPEVPKRTKTRNK